MTSSVTLVEPARLQRGARVALGEASWLARWAARRAGGLLAPAAGRPTAQATVTAPGRAPVRALPSHGLAVVRRGPQEGDAPVLLLHGMLDDRSVFARLRAELVRRGLGPVVDVEYPAHARDVRTTAAALGEVAERLLAAAGSDHLHVVGYSLGGLIARYLVQRLDGDQVVDTLVTLGTPHTGTHTARLLPATLARVLPAGMAHELRPGSAVLSELAEPARECRTRFVAYWSDVDSVVVPLRAARLEHPDLLVSNRVARGVGHLGLPHDRGVVEDVCAALAEQERVPVAAREAAVEDEATREETMAAAAVGNSETPGSMDLTPRRGLAAVA